MNEIKPWDLKSEFENGRNVMQLLRDNAQAQLNDERTIELSYDLQSGSYIRWADSPEGREQKRTFARHANEVFASLGPCQSLLEAGVGEATTLWHVVNEMPGPAPSYIHGFDLCWSRLACGAAWLSRQSPPFAVTLSSASLLELPYADNSFDLVYTAHAIEPNRDREEAILTELHRVASRFLVLLEPGYEHATPEARARMDEHRYCRGLAEKARSLGFRVVRHEPFAGSSTTMNPTSLTVIAKNESAPFARPSFACPRYRTPMHRLADCFYSPRSMRAYPIIHGIPCLRSELGIVASKLGDLTSPSGS